MLADDENIRVIDGAAHFTGNKTIDILIDGKVSETVTADQIIINTGATSIIPDIEGLAQSKYLLTSTSTMDLENLPQRVAIIGGGYIALEFASMLTTFGSKVTILERSHAVMQKEDPQIAAAAIADLKAVGIDIVLDVTTQSVTNHDGYVTVHTSAGDFDAEAVLAATGRRANIDNLGLENTDITVGSRGEVVVNEKLETSVSGIYAAGDVTGGAQFTYMSLDDFRIIRSQIFGNGERTTQNRGNVPYSVFITPTLSRVGMTYQEAIEKGLNAAENTVPVNTIPRHKINNDPRGLFKVVVDKDTQEILGASLYGDKAEELINYVKMAMDNHIPYTYMRDAIFTHPTMIESFNDLMNIPA